jgi:hypothetical protein
MVSMATNNVMIRINILTGVRSVNIDNKNKLKVFIVVILF